MNIAVSRHAELSGVRVVVIGEIDLATSDLVAAAIRSACADGPPAAVDIDLDRVSALDGAGVAMLVEAHHSAVEQHITLWVSNPHGLVEQSLRSAGVLHLLTRA